MGTDRNWDWWGKSDPYFGVLTHAQYSRHDSGAEDAEAESRRAFFATGEKHVADVLARVDKLNGPLKRTSALDFGCGVGRLVIPFARSFDQVVGLDVSPAMLAEAEANLSERDVRNVELLRSDDDLSALGGRRFALIHTYLVLQHIGRRRGYRLIGRVLDHVAEDGAFFLQVTLARRYSVAAEAKYRLLNDVPGLYKIVNRLTGRPSGQPPMRMSAYDLRKLCGIMVARGFSKLTLEFEDQGPIQSVWICGARS